MPRPKAIQFLLQGDGNKTLEGTLILDQLPDEFTTVEPTIEPYDEQGASAYAIVVIMVYGFSIVLLIASHIFLKKKEDKRDGDEQQIDKYLQQVPDLKEKSKRESFRRLKRSIIPLVSIGVGQDLSAFTQTPGGAAPRQSVFDDSILGNARRSSYENDPNRPLLDWIKRETARRASIVADTSLLQVHDPEASKVNSLYSHDDEEDAPSQTSAINMPVIEEEGSDDTSSKRNSVLYTTPNDSPGQKGHPKVSHHNDPPRVYIEDLWEAQTPESISPDRSPQLSRGHDEVFQTPYGASPSPSPPPPPLCLILDSSPRKHRPSNRYPAERSPPLLSRLQRPRSPGRHQVVSGPTSPETEDMVQVTCV